MSVKPNGKSGRSSGKFLMAAGFTILFLVLISGRQGIQAQTDTLFWFAVPEVSIDQNSFDRPIFLRLSAFAQSAYVTISQPANPAFTPQTVWVPAYNTVNVDLTSYIDQLENKPADTILNYGIYISATRPVTAYYEVASTICNCNPDIFTLKGSNALGNKFVIPMQNIYPNSNAVTPVAKSSFDIVATEPFTQVTITPSKAIIGHVPGVPFTITLQRGETYSATAALQTAVGHLGGSVITSNKPIAVTIKDDQVQPTGQTCADLMGDQIVPVDVLGTEYIAVRGFLNEQVKDRLFIVGTAPNTQIYINGSTTPLTTIGQGQTYMYELVDSSVYILSTSNIYVLHMSGRGCEIGTALLPPINCTGSVAVSFTRTTNEYFGAILIVNAGSEDDFVLNGNPTLVNPNAFFDVPGTGGTWKAASVNWSTFVPLTNASLITNASSYFHLGMINGNDGTGCRYGYYSNYSNLNLGADKLICPGDSLLLDAGAEKSDVLWSTGATTTSIFAKDSGMYWVEATLGNCTLRDSIYIYFDSSPNTDLGADTMICEGASITFAADSGQYKYRWSNYTQGQTLTVSSAGSYWVSITDTVSSCVQFDTIVLSIQPLPDIFLGNDTSICSTEIITFTPGPGYSHYHWQDGSSQSAISVFKTGTYWVIVEDIHGCIGRDTVELYVRQAPTIELGSDTVYLCNVSSIRLDAGIIDTSMVYEWQDGSQTRFYDASLPGLYYVWAGKEDCFDSDTIMVLTCTDFWIPNSFTPNGDGLNDVFRVFTSGDEDVLRFSLYIYNRWGELVFFSWDVSDSWDGKFKGTDCPVGLYNYVLTFEAAGNVLLEKEGTHRGQLLLLR
jgi:gliding motility-associated-like protein